MMKFISSIVAFSLTFILSVVLIGVPQSTNQYSLTHSNCHSHEATGIVELLRRDIRNGEMRRIEVNKIFSDAEETSVFSVTNYADYVQEYVDGSQTMNDYDLPSDFRNSWRQHMIAWRDYSNFLNKIKGSSEKPTYAEFIEMDREYTKDINRTWYQTLKIGTNYDADLKVKID